MVVMEIGTGTWCTYCPGAAMGADDLLEAGCRVAVIENHNGDPFANVYSNARNTYYGISGFPTAGFDGVAAVVGGNHSSSMYPSYLPKYNARIAVPSPVSVGMEITHNGLDYSAAITINKIGNLTPTSFKLHFFITVSHITYNWQGQTHLEHVNVKMVPDQNGTAIDFTSGNTQNVNLNFSMDPTWPIEDCEFIAFLQDATTTKEIFNSIKRGAIDLTPAFSASATTIYSNQQVTFTNETTGGYIGVPETYSWSFPGGSPATSTDQNPVITYAQPGTYDVTLIVDRGSQVDTLVKPGYITVNSPVGIAPVRHNNQTVSPNPCHGSFTIAFTGKYDMKIVDLVGNQVFKQAENMNATVFNTHLRSGTYFVVIESNGNQIVQKLLVE